MDPHRRRKWNAKDISHKSPTDIIRIMVLKPVILHWGMSHILHSKVFSTTAQRDHTRPLWIYSSDETLLNKQEISVTLRTIQNSTGQELTFEKSERRDTAVLFHLNLFPHLHRQLSIDSGVIIHEALLIFIKHFLTYFRKSAHRALV